MAGPTTTGLAALIQGEDWNYVGDTDQPAFENDWANVSGLPMLAFRVRDAGASIDIMGVVEDGTAATLFTLPTGYRPDNKTPGFTAWINTADPALVSVTPAGAVQVGSGFTFPLAAAVYLSGTIFIDSPATAP